MVMSKMRPMLEFYEIGIYQCRAYMTSADKAQTSDIPPCAVDMTSLKEHVWQTLTDMVSREDLPNIHTDFAESFVKAETCAICRKQNFLQCPKKIISYDCELIHSVLRS